MVAVVLDSTAAAEVVASTAVVAADRTVVAVTDKKGPIYSASPAASAAGLFYCPKRGLVERRLKHLKHRLTHQPFRHWLSRGLNVWYLAIE
jgi:hypothetical protein